MKSHVVILGGGTGGTVVANRLRRTFGPGELAITVVDQDDRHLYQPGLLFVPFSTGDPAGLVRSRRRQLHADIELRQAAVERVELDDHSVVLEDGSALSYDALVVASGARLAPEETEGLLGAGWLERVFTFYDLPGALALRGALSEFDHGRLVVNVVDTPIKCPVAPLEVCFLADAFLRRAGIRDRVQLTYATPLDGAFTRPVASKKLGGMLGARGIDLVTEFNTATVDGAVGRLTAYDGREVPFDLAVVVPVHVGADFVGRSVGLGDELNFVPCDPHTLQSKASPGVFAIGDATDVPASKAGSVAHFEGEVVVANVAHFLAGEPLDASFDGHTNCFIETGGSKALLVDFNYETEPLPGHFPGPVGLPLLKESRACHLGKLSFASLYWHVLLPGRDMPGVSAAMPRSGKHLPTPGHLAATQAPRT